MKIVVVDSSRAEMLTKHKDIDCLNLNCVIKRNFNAAVLTNQLSSLENINQLNLCNLASLCTKLEIDYSSKECLDLVKNIVSIIKEINPSIKLLQNKIINNIEEDLRPFIRLYQIDEEEQVLYISKYLRTMFRDLGFVDSQIPKVIKETKDVMKFIPSDIINVPLNTAKNRVAYNKIKEIVVD